MKGRKRQRDVSGNDSASSDINLEPGLLARVRAMLAADAESVHVVRHMPSPDAVPAMVGNDSEEIKAVAAPAGNVVAAFTVVPDSSPGKSPVLGLSQPSSQPIPTPVNGIAKSDSETELRADPLSASPVADGVIVIEEEDLVEGTSVAKFLASTSSDPVEIGDSDDDDANTRKELYACVEDDSGKLKSVDGELDLLIRDDSQSERHREFKPAIIGSRSLPITDLKSWVIKDATTENGPSRVFLTKNNHEVIDQTVEIDELATSASNMKSGNAGALHSSASRVVPLPIPPVPRDRIIPNVRQFGNILNVSTAPSFSTPTNTGNSAALQVLDLALEEMEPPKELTVTLHGYQKQALHWMYQRESGVIPPFGGLLADDMGLGKTVELLSVILANKRKDNLPQNTLVVCPASCMRHWMREAEYKASKCLSRRLLFHGPNRPTDYKSFSEYDLVVTSYDTLRSEFLRGKAANNSVNRMDCGPLLRFMWYRIVLDEIHMIRSHALPTSMAARFLLGRRRWGLTGTPIVNAKDDLYALLNFLEVPYVNSFANWKHIVLGSFVPRNAPPMLPSAVQRHVVLAQEAAHPFDSHTAGFHINGSGSLNASGMTYRRTETDRIRDILQPLMLRRTKQGVKMENVIPPMIVKDMRAAIEDDDEKGFYDALSDRVRLTYNRFLNQGTVMENMMGVLKLILLLRRACDHPYLVTAKHSEKTEDVENSYKGTIPESVIRSMFAITSPRSCDLCSDSLTRPIVTACGHLYCMDCMSNLLSEEDSRPVCPTCHASLNYANVSMLHRVVPPDVHEAIVGVDCDEHSDEDCERRVEKSGTPVFGNNSNQSMSTKIIMLLNKIQRIIRKDRNTKFIIFSQWVDMLNLVDSHLMRMRLRTLRYDGRMKLADRAKSLDSLFDLPGPLAMLVSLRAGGVGLNMCAANVVFVLDLWWNTEVENQAIARVHRVGQTKTVKVYRLILTGTIEDRVEELRKKKLMMSAGVLGDGTHEEAGARAAMTSNARSRNQSRLTRQELDYLLG